jgi:hypothetical protein
VSAAGCCAARAESGRTPFDYFQRGLAARRLQPLPRPGPRVSAEDGLWASFSVRVSCARLAEIRFACASCTTLIACCEALAELNRGCPLDSVCVLGVETLWQRVPGMPRGKWDRAELAVAALSAALAQAKDLLPASREEP